MIDTPPALDIEPRTVTGVGLTVPIAKALTHIMLVHDGTSRDLTIESASAELTEAAAHLNDVILDRTLYTDELCTTIEEWRAAVRQLGGAFSTAAIASPDSPLTDDHKDDLRQLATRTWALLTLIDREITGLPLNHTDPGRQP